MATKTTKAQETFDSWVDTQTKTMDNFVETTKKLQQTMMDGKFMESGADIYKTWFEKQKAIMETTFSTDFAKTFKMDEMPMMKDYMDKFNEMQTKMFGNKWMETMKDMMEKNSKFPSMDWSSVKTPEDMLKEVRKAYDSWNTIYGDWFSHTSKNFEGIKSFLNGQSGANTFTDMFNTSQVYMKMYEVWQPMMETMKKNMEKMGKDAGFDNEWMSSFKPEAYKEAIDKVFKFAKPEKFKEFYEQITTFSNDYLNQAKSAQTKLADQFNMFTKEMASSAKPNWSGMVQSFNEQMDKFYGPYSKLIPDGKEKEAVEAFNEVQEKLSVYWTKYSELQYMIYVASQKAMDIVAQDMTSKVKEGVVPGNFNDFFNNWVNVTEKSVTEAFGTEEFSKTQGELLSTGMEIKKTMEKQMESILSAYPVVSRSEADEMVQIIHDLKARVRSLEKKLSGGSDVAEVAVEEKKTTTRKTAEKA